MVHTILILKSKIIKNKFYMNGSCTQMFKYVVKGEEK